MKDVDAEGLESSQKAAIGAIQDPVSLFVQQRNILSLPAIQSLQKKSGKSFDHLMPIYPRLIQDTHGVLSSA
jgi:hypothetical protein